MRGGQTNYAAYDIEAGNLSIRKDTHLRSNFMRKVTGIIFVQFLTTALFVAATIHVNPYRQFISTKAWLLHPAFAVTLVCSIVLSCFQKVGRSVPINYILLFTLTVAEGFTLSFLPLYVRSDIILSATVITAAMTGGLVLYALTTKSDFTVWGSSVFLFGMAVFAAGILGMFYKAAWLHILLSLAGVLVGGVYLIYDLQLIAGNKQNRFSLDDYILAAMSVYFDIIRIFFEIVKLLVLTQRSNS